MENKIKELVFIMTLATQHKRKQSYIGQRYYGGACFDIIPNSLGAVTLGKVKSLLNSQPELRTTLHDTDEGNSLSLLQY